MISKKTTYGLQAAIILAKRFDKAPALITDLAKEGHIPKKFLETILLELRKNGILNSKKGKGGGYVLAKEPQDITVGDIVRSLQVSFLEIDVLSTTRETDEINLVMKDLGLAVSNILDKTSLADIIERARSGQNVLNYMI